MKQKLLFLLRCLCIPGLLFAQGSTLHVIPEPVQITQGTEQWVATTPLSVYTNAANGSSGMYLKNLMQIPNFCTQSNQSNSSIRLIKSNTTLPNLGNEGYALTVNEKGVEIISNTDAGLYYGTQTLLQLVPATFLGTSPSSQTLQIPFVEITDYPRFGWRGLMLDVSRHFFTKEEVKQYIDQMARYKFNLLHWHLTDDEGWRIEIKSLPKLTEIGAWRVDKTGYFNDMQKPLPNEPKTYGGFYTQNDIREIVAYAAERNVQILPEIDVPGHSLAAIVSYPELSCTPEANTYQVRSGEKIMNWYAHGKFDAIYDNTLCPANEKVYEFLNKVIQELAQMFPFEYIHIGGDECAKNFWEKSPEVKRLMLQKNIKSVHDVQGYFTKRLSEIVAANHRKSIGWDEISETQIPAGTAIMSWRGEKAGIQASKAGYPVVMTPMQYCYLDFMQGDKAIESQVYASLRLKKTYEYDPLPAGANPAMVLGGQGNLWTEQIYNLRYAQYMTWPRAFSISESLWSPKAKKDWNHFVAKTESHFRRFDSLKIKYATSIYEPDIKVTADSAGSLQITLVPEIEGLDLHYSFDNSFPDQFYPKYTKPLIVPKDAYQLKLATYKNGTQMGRYSIITISELRNRIKN